MSCCRMFVQSQASLAIPCRSKDLKAYRNDPRPILGDDTAGSSHEMMTAECQRRDALGVARAGRRQTIFNPLVPTYIDHPASHREKAQRAN